jgi:hypothetical protein
VRPDPYGAFVLDCMAAHGTQPYLGGVASQLDGGREFGTPPLHPCYSVFAGSSAYWPSERATRTHSRARSGVS